jgi:ribosomal protein L1
VAVFAKGAKAEEAKKAGADLVGAEDWPPKSRPARSISTAASPRRT